MIKLKHGINIGDHFENDSVSSKDFKNPMQDWYYPLIKNLGFDHIRLPIRWSVHCDNNFKINDEFIRLVDKTVNRFLKMDIAVIINIHHFREAAEYPAKHVDELTYLWEQIGEYFKNYSEKLIFEVLNEPRWNVESSIWNNVQNHLIKVIRKTNPTRKIMVGGVYFNDVYHMNEMIIPENDKNLIGTFHYYYPMEFTHQGAIWTPKYVDLHDVTWVGNEHELKELNDAFDLAVNWSEKYGLPVNIGEFGAIHKAPAAYRSIWTRSVRTAAENRGFSWTYWELNRNFGISDKDNPELDQPIVDALLKD